jgi:predicted dehydrogenase
MEKIGIGVMGCASIARRMVIPAILTLHDQFDLIAVASRTAEKAGSMAADFNTLGITGYENLLDRTDIKAIYMPLPTGLHKEWIIKALNAGKHVFVEKSLALNFEEAEELVALARSKKLVLMENFMFRHHAQHKAVWDFLQKGEIGNIRLFRSQFCFPPMDTGNFRYEKTTGGGSLLDAGAYTIRASSWFLGKGLRVESAVLYMDHSRDTDIFGNATFMNQKGIVAQVSFGFDNFYKCNYEIDGTSGTIIVPKAFTPKPIERTAILLEKPGEPIRLEIEPDNHFCNILKAFHFAVASGQHEDHLQDILEQSRIITEVNHSATKINYESTNYRL